MTPRIITNHTKNSKPNQDPKKYLIGNTLIAFQQFLFGQPLTVQVGEILKLDQILLNLHGLGRLLLNLGLVILLGTTVVTFLSFFAARFL